MIKYLIIFTLKTNMVDILYWEFLSVKDIELIQCISRSQYENRDNEDGCLDF